MVDDVLQPILSPPLAQGLHVNSPLLVPVAPTQDLGNRKVALRPRDGMEAIWRALEIFCDLEAYLGPEQIDVAKCHSSENRVAPVGMSPENCAIFSVAKAVYLILMRLLFMMGVPSKAAQLTCPVELDAQHVVGFQAIAEHHIITNGW